VLLVRLDHAFLDAELDDETLRRERVGGELDARESEAKREGTRRTSVFENRSLSANSATPSDLEV